MILEGRFDPKRLNSTTLGILIWRLESYHPFRSWENEGPQMRQFYIDFAQDILDALFQEGVIE